MFLEQLTRTLLAEEQGDRAEGARLYDAQGNSWIDAISSWWVTTHGHAHPRIMAAIRDQSEKLDQLIFAGWTHEPAEALATELIHITPDPLTRVFFSDSGSTSVEVALKMALGYWFNIGEARSRILVLEHSYHGDTIGTMSVGERGVYNRAWQPLLFDVDTIPFPHEGREQATLDALEAACKHKPAAFIVEPLILGAGGMLGALLSGYTWDHLGAAWTFTIGSGFALAGLVWLLFGWRSRGGAAGLAAGANPSQ